MSELLDDGPTGNTPEFSVSDLSGAVKRLIEGEFAHVRVRGEVGRTMLARTGHMYFDLKDDKAVIGCVSWKGQVAKMAHRPEEGMEVIATGRMTTYGPQSKYQLNVERIEPAGAGALMAMLEARKKALQAEGLFAADRKQPLPYLPEVIGVITSPSGAVIRDILHRLRDRFPRTVLIWPVAVQGQACAPEVARAIAGFNALTPGGALPRPDLLIVARGGGSVEDLWGFNEEAVARAAAASEIPLISAVGHETDTTLIDYVSDRRAPTPTAAAEIAVPVRAELLAWTVEQGARLSRALTDGVARRRQRLGDLSRGLPRVDTLLDNPRQRLDRADERLRAALAARVQRERLRLGEASAGLRPAAMQGRIDRQKDRLSGAAARLDPARLSQLHQRQADRYGAMAQNLSRVATGRQDRLRDRLEALERMRQSLGYVKTLERGYAVVRVGDQVITTQAEAARRARLDIEFSDGRLPVIPESGTPPTSGGPTAAKPRKPKTPKDTPDQGSLF
ncbi:exodeoxyribonuclease VII large subunit [Aliiroseovarius sp. PTFE2010]|uniref:exodeoxyribonuclease VII large subunit n=1 Tax=Aliiroseovarius sp. PTFE2010 TaxID=3417190 RepID=UPI003CF2238C